MSLIFQYAAELNAQMQYEYDEAVVLQMSIAEDKCKGVLFNKRGRASCAPVTQLFKGPAGWAYKHASEELMDYWGQYPRIVRAEFERLWCRERGIS